MFVGHYAVALAGKRAAPRVSLGTLILAAQFLDLLWPFFLLLQIEHVRLAPGYTAFTPLDFYDYPISHSLLTTLLWAAAFAAVYFLLRRNGRGSLVLAAAVISHWVLDAISHRPDLPFTPGSHRYFGLGLWNSVPATLAVEISLFLAGVFLYATTTGPRNGVGRWAWWTFVALLGVMYVGNALGPPPPDTKSLAWVGLGQWLLVAFGYWIDRHRVAAIG